MQESEESTTESVSESRGDFVFVCETTITHLELLDVRLELVVVFCIDWVDSSKDIGDDFLKSWNRMFVLWSTGKNSISDAGFLECLNSCDDVADFS
jgi:hypothetical protein